LTHTPLPPNHRILAAAVPVISGYITIVIGAPYPKKREA